MIRSIALFFLFCMSSVAMAATDEFNVATLVGADTVPPTTPTALTATPITTSQIDLSWGASTDNFILGGYQVYRGATQIATTTLTTYSDSGLTASTTYTYFVVAFDTEYNFSSSSNIVSTTTLPVVIVPPTPTSTPAATTSGGTQATRLPLELKQFDIKTDTSTALLDWEVNRYVRFTLRWGRTLSYELGYVINDVYKTAHETVISDLEPGTTYDYELVAYDRLGKSTILKQDQFTTVALPDVNAPANVSDLSVVVDGNDVQLSWMNPKDDFSYVRVVRNPLFYPTDPRDGFVIYQDNGQSFRDRNILSQKPVVYYTVYVFDKAGNRSSGATIAARLSGGSSAVGTQPEPEQVLEVSPAQPFGFSLDNVIIRQGNEIIHNVSDTYLVDTEQPFTISAPVDIFPKYLKAIQVTFVHPIDETLSFSFLLRLNNDQTAYEATVDDLGFVGTIPMSFAVYDYKTQVLSTAEASIISKTVEPQVAVIKDITPWFVEHWWFFPLLLLLLFLIWLWATLRRVGRK